MQVAFRRRSVMLLILRPRISDGQRNSSVDSIGNRWLDVRQNEGHSHDVGTPSFSARLLSSCGPSPSGAHYSTFKILPRPVTSNASTELRDGQLCMLFRKRFKTIVTLGSQEATLSVRNADHKSDATDNDSYNIKSLEQSCLTAWLSAVAGVVANCGETYFANLVVHAWILMQVLPTCICSGKGKRWLTSWHAFSSADPHFSDMRESQWAPASEIFSGRIQFSSFGKISIRSNAINHCCHEQ